MQCKFCKKEFQNQNTRWKHEKICTYEPPLSKSSNLTTVHTQNNYNGTVNVTNNIQNNNVNIQIAAFPMDPRMEEQLFFIPQEKRKEFFQEIKQLYRDNGTTLAIENAILRLFDMPMYKMLRKPDMKNGWTYVHMGNDKWEMHTDKRIYPKLVHKASSDLAQSYDEAPPCFREPRLARELGEFSGNVWQLIDDQIDGRMTPEEQLAKRNLKNIERSMKIKAHYEYLKNPNTVTQDQSLLADTKE